MVKRKSRCVDVVFLPDAAAVSLPRLGLASMRWPQNGVNTSVFPRVIEHGQEEPGRTVKHETSMVFVRSHVYTMTSKRTKFSFQKRLDSTSSYHCCVPRCSSSARCNSALSFFTFPKDIELQKKWIINIRRDQIQVTGNTRVCSRHFLSADVISRSTPQGRRLLKRGALPVLFEWNKYSLPAPRSGVWEWREQSKPLSDDLDDLTTKVARPDHDYCSSVEPAAVDSALSPTEALRSENAALRRRIEEMTVSCKFGLERFAASDDDIRLYTRFASYGHLMSFWSQIESALPDMVRVTGVQTATPEGHVRCAVSTSLQPIDEFFLFMTYLSLGLVLKDLANRFKIHKSTVSSIISTWANFLYSVLGVIGIWLDEETVKQNMPEVFSDFADTHIVLDCTELRCQTPDSSYKSHSKFKGLIGMAPHGSVTFVSPLYESCIVDREILKQSGLLSLLKPSMAIMVDESFLVEDLVPCKVYIPAFLKKKTTQLSIGRLRVHVEHILRRVKAHKLFSTVIPLSLSGSVNQLFAVTCLLVNFQN